MCVFLYVALCVLLCVLICVPLRVMCSLFRYLIHSAIRYFMRYVMRRQQHSPYFCDSPKNACGIKTKGLERVYKTESKTGERSSLLTRHTGVGPTHLAFGASRRPQTDWSIKVYVMRSRMRYKCYTFHYAFFFNPPCVMSYVP